MGKFANFPPEFWQNPVIDVTTGKWTDEAIRIFQGTLNSDNLPDGNTRQQTKASNLLASDIPTNSDFEEFNDTGVVAYAWEGQWDDAGTTTLDRNFYRMSTSAFRGSKCQMLISPDNVRGSSIASQPFAVKPFLQWHPSVWAKSDAALPVGAKGFRYRVAWFNSNSDFSKAGVASYTDVVLGSDTTLSTTFQEFGADVAVPASARFARLVLYNHGPSKGSNFASNLLVDTTSWGLKSVNRLTQVSSASGTTIAGGSVNVVDSMSIPITTAGEVVELKFTSSPFVDTAGTSLQFSFFRDGGLIGILVNKFYINAAVADGVSMIWDDQPAAGNHTYDVRWQVLAGAGVHGTMADRAFQTFQAP